MKKEPYYPLKIGAAEERIRIRREARERRLYTLGRGKGVCPECFRVVRLVPASMAATMGLVPVGVQAAWSQARKTQVHVAEMVREGKMPPVERGLVLMKHRPPDVDEQGRPPANARERRAFRRATPNLVCPGTHRKPIQRAGAA